MKKSDAVVQRLTGEMICKEALRLLSGALAGLAPSYLPNQEHQPLTADALLGLMARGEAVYGALDVELSLDQFSEKFLRKPVAEMAEQILRAVAANGGKCEVITADLPLPMGMDVACRSCTPSTGMSLRLVRAYDINRDRFLTCLDVRYGLRNPAERTQLERLAGNCRRAHAAYTGLAVQEQAAHAHHIELNKVCDEANTMLLKAHRNLADYLATGVGVVEIPATKSAA